MLNKLEFSQRQMARDIGKDHGAGISGFVNRLEKMGYVRKNPKISIKKPNYEVVSPVALLEYTTRLRNMNELRYRSFDIGNDRNEVKRLICEKNAILCLSTALEYYDEYYRDPAIHAYAQDLNILQDLMNEQTEGNIKVIFYKYDIPDEIEIQNGIRRTSPIRTIIDMYCNNLAYAVDPLIRKVLSHGK